VYWILVGKSGGKRPLGRPRHKWESGIRMDLRAISWDVWSGFNWHMIGTGGGLCDYGNEPSGSGATDLQLSNI
jgi:hypothetical protein